LIMTCLNYTALAVLFIGCFYMHYFQRLNWFVYFCLLFSASVFVIHAVLILDVYVFIQNSLFLTFDAVGVVKMYRVKKNDNSSGKGE